MQVSIKGTQRDIASSIEARQTGNHIHLRIRVFVLTSARMRIIPTDGLTLNRVILPPDPLFPAAFPIWSSMRWCSPTPALQSKKPSATEKSARLVCLTGMWRNQSLAEIFCGEKGHCCFRLKFF